MRERRGSPPALPSVYLGADRPWLWSNNGGVRRRLRSAPGARGASHHLRRMLAGLRRDARRLENSRAPPAARPRRRAPGPGPARPRPPLRGPSGGGSRARLHGPRAPPLCSPFPRPPQQWGPPGSPAPAGPRPASPPPLPGLRRARPPGRHLRASLPATGAAGPTRGAEARDPAAPEPRGLPRGRARRL